MFVALNGSTSVVYLTVSRCVKIKELLYLQFESACVFTNIRSSISDQNTAVGVLQSWLAIHFIVMLTSTQDRFTDVFKFTDYF